MSPYLCIRVTWPADRYHGEEWPPSPARLFQALLAGARTGAARRHWPACEAALLELERLPPPEIFAAKASVGAPFRIAVPNNDADKAAREWAAGRAFDAAKLRSMKSLRPHQLPPSGPALAHAYYLWPSQSSPAAPPQRRLASLLHTLGLGLDMAFADASLLGEHERAALLRRPGFTHLAPTNNGARQWVPAPGALDELQQRFAEATARHSSAGVAVVPPPARFARQAYSDGTVSYRPYAAFALRQLANPDAWFSLPWQHAPIAAAWARHAASTVLRVELDDERIASFVLGHHARGAQHLCFVPLPTIRRGSADGAVRRLLLLEPPGSDGAITDLLQVKLTPSTLLRLRNGAPPEPACQLGQLEPSDLLLRTYTAESRAWRTVTPVVLHGHNSEHRKFSPKKTLALLEAALAKAGFDAAQIANLAYQPAPFWPGTGAAYSFQVPAHLRAWPRYHVAVRFRDPVRGPLLAGIGQYYGAGLFAPWVEEP